MLRELGKRVDEGAADGFLDRHAPNASDAAALRAGAASGA